MPGSRVTNLWPNRLIGDDRLYADDCEWKGEKKNGVNLISIKEIPQWVKDGQRSPTGRHTFTTWKHWDKGPPAAALRPAWPGAPAHRRSRTISRTSRRSEQLFRAEVGE